MSLWNRFRKQAREKGQPRPKSTAPTKRADRNDLVQDHMELDGTASHELLEATGPKAYHDMKAQSQYTAALNTPTKFTFSGNTAADYSRQHNGNVYNYGDVTYNNTIPLTSPTKTEQKGGNQHWLVKRPPNGLFTGQQDVSDDIERSLRRSSQQTEPSQFVLSGIGGVGKSEIALQFASRNRAEYWGVFWVDCSSAHTAKLGFSNIARACGFLGGGQDEDIIAVVEMLSNSKETWLLILDNCDDPNIDYASYFPSGSKGSTIMTTRLDLELEYGARGYRRMDGLNAEDSVTLLAKAAKLPAMLPEPRRVAAEQIVAHVGYHALAIIVAGSMIKAGLYTLEEYGQALARTESELLITKPKQAQSTYGTIHATFEVSARRLEASDEESARHALELLGILAYLDRAIVTEALFMRAWDFALDCWDGHYEMSFQSDHHVRPENQNEDEVERKYDGIKKLSEWHLNKTLSFEWASSDNFSMFRRARGHLVELALVSLADEHGSIAMHPLLHSWARNRLSKDEKAASWSSAAATLTLSSFMISDWHRYTMHLWPHIEACFGLLTPDIEQTIPLFDLGIMLYLFWVQLFRAESDYIYDVVDTITRLLEPHIDERSDAYPQLLVLKAMSNQEARDYTTAAELQTKALSFLRNTLGREHSETRIAQKLLGQILTRSGDLTAGIDVLEDLKRIEDEFQDQEPLDWAHTLHELSFAYSKAGRHQDSIGLILQVIEVREEYLPADHRSLMGSLHQLAVNYQMTAQYEKAQELLEKVVVTVSEYLKPGSDLRDSAQFNLAKLYLKTGQIPAAINLLEEVCLVWAKVLPPTHKLRLDSQGTLVDAYFESNQFEKAAEFLEHVLAMGEQFLPPQHEDLWLFQQDLAWAYYLQGDFARAILKQQPVVDFRSLQLSPTDQRRYGYESLLLRCHIYDGQITKSWELLNHMRQTKHLLCEEDQKDLKGLEDTLLKRESEAAMKLTVDDDTTALSTPPEEMTLLHLDLGPGT